MNPTLTHTEGNTIPLSPPPSYEHVLEENRLAALDKENNKTSTLSLSPSGYDMFGSNQQLTACTPQDQQQQNYDLQSQQQQHQQATPNTTRKQESIDSSLYSCSEGTSPSQENLLGCTGSCDPLYNMVTQEHMEDLAEEMEDMHIEETCLSSDNLDNGSLTDECHSYDAQAYEGTSTGSVMRPQTEIKGPEILYKSSKQLYKAVAKECGITCKMSDQCRCLDCQSRYFDCEYDQNENEKTDGGLGAGTPMFISEVMHGSACTIL